MLPEILFLGWFVFPEGSAGAQYVHGLGKALRAAGHSVGYVVDGSEGRLQDRLNDGSFVCDGFKYYPLGMRRKRSWLLSRIWSVGEPLDLTLEWLASQDLHGVRHIFTYSGSCAYLMRLRAFCNRRGITLTNLVVEWYSPRQTSFRNPLVGCSRLFDSELQRRVVNRLIGSQICISRFLHRHCLRQGSLSVVVPHLLDLNEDKWPRTVEPRRDHPGLNLVFAGSGGMQDLLHHAVRGLALLGEQAKGVKINICGPGRESVARLLGRNAGLLNDLAGQLVFRGMLPYRQALTEVARADFSIMLRLNARFTRAGFPTKLGESLGCGVPILGNLTGDVGLYVRDGVEGIVTSDCAPESFAQGLARALSLPATIRHAMRLNARRRAAESLDFRNYAQVLNEFLRRLSRRATPSDNPPIKVEPGRIGTSCPRV